MGLFDGKILQLGEKLSESFREKASECHIQASDLVASGRSALAMRASLKGEVLEDIAEVIEKVTRGD